MRLLSSTLFTSLAAAQGYLSLDLGRRHVPSESWDNRILRRQNDDNGNPVYASLYQNTNRLEYILNITIGTPAQHLGVTLDTGSSDLWVPTPRMCQAVGCDLGEYDPDKSTSYKLLLEDGFNITYAGPGDSDAGDWGSDTVQIAGASAISNQIIGVALAGFDNHGVMGIGFDTNETPVNPSQSGIYRSVLDNLVAQGVISRKAFSIYLNSLNESVGSVIFGGVDKTKYSGDLVVLPLQPSPGTNTVAEYYVTLTQVAFTDAAGKESVLTPNDYALSVLLDSGTSSTLLDADTASHIAIGLGAVDSGEQNYVVPCSVANTNATITYTFGGSDGVAITVPVSELIAGEYENQCDLNISPPLGGSAIMGDSFMRSAYAVFDLDNKIAALAQAVDGRASTSSVEPIPSGSTIPGAARTASAPGTSLTGAAARATGSVPLASSHHSSIAAGTPTFNLGAAATSHTGNVAPLVTAHPQAAMLGVGLAAGMLLL